MILSICPNPSIDCTIELDNLCVGKLNRIDNKVETYSGKALNVAIGIARLKEKCLATGFMFDNHRHTFENNLKKEGVDFDSLDGKPVDLVFLLVSPENSGADHLTALATLSRVLKTEGSCEKLRKARSIDDIYAVLNA